MIIHLKDLIFFGYHGVHEEEQILGNEFIVNVKITTKFMPSSNLELNQTVNYESVFTVIKGVLDIPTLLLESLVIEIGNKLLEQFLQILEVDVSIYKKNPPIKGYIGNVGVNQSFKRN